MHRADIVQKAPASAWPTLPWPLRPASPPTAPAAGLALCRTSFQKQLLPGFEAACQSMFAQINGSLAQGFQEHLQVRGQIPAGFRRADPANGGKGARAGRHFSSPSGRPCSQI